MFFIISVVRPSAVALKILSAGGVVADIFKRVFDSV
jgi:hypothetical protein